ncbi:MAG TPA: TonB family protein [Methylomirabilota bacterium]|nr:TonB family protein [Methylomirabilota bacterium]
MTTATLQTTSPAALPQVSLTATVGPDPTARQEITWIGVLTLVLWASCITIGTLGFVLPYTRPRPPAKPPEPVQAEILHVELSNDPLPLPDVAPAPPDPSQPPPLADLAVTPPPPPMVAVAPPSPAIAFALPVQGPVRVVEAAQAASVAPPAAMRVAPVTAPPLQQLVHGRGEGRQPAPEYPPQALRAGQEGTVRVRFSVGQDGRVIAAAATQPCPWALLNAAAVRVVRERWRFPAGPMRLYEVAIRFEIKKRGEMIRATPQMTITSGNCASILCNRSNTMDPGELAHRAPQGRSSVNARILRAPVGPFAHQHGPRPRSPRAPAKSGLLHRDNLC